MPPVAPAGEGGAAPQHDNVVAILLVFKMEISSNPAEIQRLIEGLVVVTAGALREGVESHLA